MDDLISRQAAIDLCKQRLYETAINNSGYKCDADDVYSEMAERRISNWLNDVPSVQTEQKWIPVKKELPKDRSWNLGIFRESDTGWVNPIPFVCDYVGRKTPITTKDFWIIKEHDGAIDYYRNLECVAWQPLPESYRGDDK